MVDVFIVGGLFTRIKLGSCSVMIIRSFFDCIYFVSKDYRCFFGFA